MSDKKKTTKKTGKGSLQFGKEIKAGYQPESKKQSPPPIPKKEKGNDEEK